MSAQRIGVRRICWAKLAAACAVSGEVSSPSTISTHARAGEMEADDLVRAQRDLADLGDRELADVLEARIAWPGVAASSSAKTSCLISIFLGRPRSRSRRRRSRRRSRSAVIRPRIRSTSARRGLLGQLALLDELRRRLLTSRAFASPASTSFWSTSLSRTGMPAAAIAWAISPPITPAPTTAALNTNMARDPSDPVPPPARRRTARACARSDSRSLRRSHHRRRRRRCAPSVSSSSSTVIRVARAVGLEAHALRAARPCASSNSSVWPRPRA